MIKQQLGNPKVHSQITPNLTSTTSRQGFEKNGSFPLGNSKQSYVFDAS